MREKHQKQMPLSLGLFSEIKHYGDLARKVYDQTFRRVVQGESVPADQKVFSIFEDHTDIIIKDRRDTYYGCVLFQKTRSERSGHVPQ